MSENQSGWKDVTFFKTILVGSVVEDPQIFPNGNGKGALLKVNVTYSNPPSQDGGKWQTVDQIIPLYDTNPSRVENLIIPHIKAKRTIVVEAKYKSWVDGNGQAQHGFEVISMQPGWRPYEANGQGTADGQKRSSFPFPT